MGRVAELWQMLSERRVGFVTNELMKGTHRYVRDFPEGKVTAGTELPFFFQARWGHPHLSRFLNPLSNDFLFAVMEGEVTAGGLTGEAPLKGGLELRYHKDATIRYSFEFDAQGRTLRYEGEKRDIRPWNLHRTHTTCYGTVTDLSDGKLLSESVVTFDLHTLHRFLASFRLG